MLYSYVGSTIRNVVLFLNWHDNIGSEYYNNNNNNNNSANRPDITLTNKKTKTTYLIDIAVQNTHNLAKTITEKQSKYQELANEMCAMWKQNIVLVIPIVISSTGVIPKSLLQSLQILNLHPITYTGCPTS